jgi:hypothetical protein
MARPLRCLAKVIHTSKEAVTVVDDEDKQWSALHNEVGEALLDIERTFMNIVDLQTGSPNNVAVAPDGDAFVQAYLEAWGRLQGAHRSLALFLVNKMSASSRGSVVPALRRCRYLLLLAFSSLALSTFHDPEPTSHTLARIAPHDKGNLVPALAFPGVDHHRPRDRARTRRG